MANMERISRNNRDLSMYRIRRSDMAYGKRLKIYLKINNP